MFVVLSDLRFTLSRKAATLSRMAAPRLQSTETRPPTAASNGSTNIRLPTSGLSVMCKQPSIRRPRGHRLQNPVPTGSGLGYQAVNAMISELVGHYGVCRLSAVLVRGNLRSKRLLERLAFSLASPEQHAAHRVAPGEMLMRREITTDGGTMKQTRDDVIMKIAPPATADDANWLFLRSRLWPDGPESEHLTDMADALRGVAIMCGARARSRRHGNRLCRGIEAS
jgi:hypothetical protein